MRQHPFIYTHFAASTTSVYVVLSTETESRRKPSLRFVMHSICFLSFGMMANAGPGSLDI